MSRKASAPEFARQLIDIPNIGPAMADDLRQLGIHEPSQLVGKDPYALYSQLNRITGQRHDPCVCDSLIAAVRFMETGDGRPWWHWTAERKRYFSNS